MPVSDKQKGYARKWDKDNMRTIATRVRTEEAEDFKAWCARQGISSTALIKQLVMSELDKYYKVLDAEHEKQINGKKLIETDRLILRPFREGDEADLLEYLSKPTVNCFMDMKINSLREAKDEIIKRSNELQPYFAVVLKSADKVIGEVFAYAEGESGDTYSPCWMLNAGYQGKGYAFEAVSAFFEYLFSEKNARRLYAYTEDYNIRSQHLCEKLGMRKEGLFKEFISFVTDQDRKPVYENTLQYAILKSEWRSG